MRPISGVTIGLHTAWLVMPFVLAATSLAVAESPAASQPVASDVRIGDAVASFSFKDIRYLPRSLADFGEKRAFVLVFTTLDCPLVQRYLPKLKDLEHAYRDQNVQFVAVNVGSQDPLIEVAYQAVRYDVPFPFVKDLDGQVVRAVGATRTPQVVVLDRDRRLRYRGRIDSQYRLGGVKPDAGRDDLKLAIDEILAGREVAVAETPVDGCRIGQLSKTGTPQDVTFSEHVAVLLQKHCQDCHHPGNGPFSLVSYEDALSHAATIAEVVEEGRMPPWYGSREHGKFSNHRGLTPAEKSLFVDWVRAGSPQGDPGRLPAPRQFPKTDWRIGEPDLVLKAPQPMKLPASGYVPYQYVFLPYVFTHDTWVQKVEIRPSNPATVHHCNMAFVQPGGKFSDANFITGQVPGGDTLDLRDGMAFMIPKLSLLVLQIHYVTTGMETTDQISVGICYAKETVQKQLKHLQVKNTRFQIPPGDPHYAVNSSRILKNAVTGVGMFSHMHLRGKDMTFTANYPDGRQEKLLAIPNYSFDWQMPYRWAAGEKKFPAGTRIEVQAHFDNSPFNPYNPDPLQTVEEGQQTFQEMMYGFFFYTEDAEQLNLAIDPKTGRQLEKHP